MISRNPNRVLASQWIRIFQLQPHLEFRGISTRVNHGYFDSDVVVFARAFGRVDYKLASFLRSRGVRVVLDFVVDYFAEADYGSVSPIGKRQSECARAMLSVADAVICSSREIQRSVERFHPRVFYIPDSLDSSHFGQVHEDRLQSGFQGEFAWSGQASKLRDLEPILPILAEQNMSLRVITNNVTASKHYLASLGVSASVHPWDHASFTSLLGMSELGISYRVLSPYNRGHSSFKLLGPMSQGLPVLASPLASYSDLLENGGGKIIRSDDEWGWVLRDKDFLNNLIATQSRPALAAARDYQTSRIVDLYLNVFGSL